MKSETTKQFISENIFVEKIRIGNRFKIDYVRNFLEKNECDCLFDKLEKILKEKGSDNRRKNRTFGDGGRGFIIKLNSKIMKSQG